jgi:DNA primase
MQLLKVTPIRYTLSMMNGERPPSMDLPKKYPAALWCSAWRRSDSFIRKNGVEAFYDRVGKSVPIFEHFVRELCRQTDTGNVEGKVRVLEELAPRFAKMGNLLERDLYLREVSRFVGVEENILRNRFKLGGSPLSANAQIPRKEKGKSGTGAEEMLLSLMGKYPEVAEKVREFGVSQLFSENLIQVAESILLQAAAGSKIDWPMILDHVKSPEERNRLITLFVDDRHLEDIDAHKAFEQCCSH